MIGLISTASPATARHFQAPVAVPSASAKEFHLPSARYELKFRINETTALAIRDYARAFVVLDPYADRRTFSYPISSLYLDSDELLTFWTTVNGTRRNYKLRVRTYDDRPDSPVFFEVKRGLDDTILKERGAVRAGAVERILAGNLPAADDMFSSDPTHRVAVENFVRLMQQIGARPKAYVRYVREAWIGRDDKEVRFTMDRDIGVSPQSTAGFPAGEVAGAARPFGRMVVLEIKFNRRMPLWFRDLAAVIGLRQEPAAKYCDGLRMHGLGEFNPVDWPATNPARRLAPTVAPTGLRFAQALAPSLLAGLRGPHGASARFGRPPLPTALFASSRSTRTSTTMNLTDWLTRGDNAHASLDLSLVLLALGLSFLGGHVLAWVYQLTHGGLTVSRSFVHTLVLLPVLVALVMLALHDNLVTAFGMMSVFAIVRFRNVLIDPADTIYVLAAIIFGMATGTQRFSLAVIGGTIVAATLLYLSTTGFGERLRHGMLLNLHWTRPPVEIDDLNALLKRYGYDVECTSHRANDAGGADLSYRLLLRDPAQFESLVAELNSLDGVSRLTSLRAEDQTAT